MKKDLVLNIEMIDLEISKILVDISNIADKEKRNELYSELDKLTEVRASLANDQANASNKEIWITGGFSLATVLLVLYYEKADVITSKTFNMATRMFKGV